MRCLAEQRKGVAQHFEMMEGGADGMCTPHALMTRHTSEHPELCNLFGVGWQQLASAYRSGARVAKKYDIANAIVVDESLLRELAAARVAIVNDVFECCKRLSPSISKQSFGSQDVTSDYDVTIVGPGACLAMWCMFVTFARTFGTLFPFSCDTNLYANGTYSSPVNKRADLLEHGCTSLRAGGGIGDMNTFTVVPAQKRQGAYVDTVTAWALCKCILGGLDSALAERLVGRDIVAASRAKLAMTQSMVNTTRAITDGCVRSGSFGAALVKSATHEDLDTVARYALQAVMGSRMEGMLYAERASTDLPPTLSSVHRAIINSGVNVGAMSLADCMCATMFFSVEAAYTQSTVNVVVLEMQAKRAVSLPRSEYRVSALENLGELLVHTQQGPPGSAVPLSTVLKVSKYVLRIVHSLARCTPDVGTTRRLREIETAIAERVIPLRGRKSFDGVAQQDLDLVWYTGGATYEQYRQEMCDSFEGLWYGTLPSKWITWRGGAGGGGGDAPCKVTLSVLGACFAIAAAAAFQ